MNKKEAIFVLGGGLKKDEKGRWRTANFGDRNEFGVMGGSLRAVAAGYLYKDNPNKLIVSSGGNRPLKGTQGAPAVAEVIKDELKELGVPEEDIAIEANSKNTYAQIREMKKIIDNNKLEKVIVISNEYHLPRVKAMIEQDDEMKKMLANSIIKLQSAEEIVIKYEPKRAREIKSIYKSQSMKDRIALEQKGIEAIEKGTYKFE